MPDLLVCDVNNSRRVLDWTRFRKFSPVMIAKMTEGVSYVAPSFKAHRAGAQAAGFAAFGAYHFWTPGADPHQQAVNAIRAIGDLADDGPVEWLILDVETGTDFDEYEKFCEFTDAALGRTTWLYGGRQLDAADSRRPLWVARYPASKQPDLAKQPGIGEVLWQFTDAYPVPGLSVATADCSIHRGDLASLLTKIRGDEDMTDADLERIESIIEAKVKPLRTELAAIHSAIDTIYGRRAADGSDFDPTHHSIGDLMDATKRIEAALGGGVSVPQGPWTGTFTINPAQQ